MFTEFTDAKVIHADFLQHSPRAKVFLLGHPIDPFDIRSRKGFLKNRTTDLRGITFPPPNDPKFEFDLRFTV